MKSTASEPGLKRSQFTSVGEEWINNQFASWMKDHLIYVEMFCISRRTTRNYFWNPFLHALYIANVIINGVWYYFQCKFSCSYFKIHSSKPRLTDTSLHGHLFLLQMVFMIPEIPKSIQFSLYSGVHFLDTKLCPSGVQKKWFYCTYFHIEAPDSANYDCICLCLHFFHYYAFNVSWSEIVILIFKLVDKILYCYHGLPFWQILFALMYFCCQEKLCWFFFFESSWTIK